MRDLVRRASRPHTVPRASLSQRQPVWRAHQPGPTTEPPGGASPGRRRTAHARCAISPGLSAHARCSAPACVASARRERAPAPPRTRAPPQHALSACARAAARRRRASVTGLRVPARRLLDVLIFASAFPLGAARAGAAQPRCSSRGSSTSCTCSARSTRGVPLGVGRAACRTC